MEISRTIIVFDAADPDEVSSFWARLLGGIVDPEDDWHTVRVDGEARLGIQLAPDHVRRSGRPSPVARSSRFTWTSSWPTRRPRTSTR